MIRVRVLVAVGCALAATGCAVFAAPQGSPSADRTLAPPEADDPQHGGDAGDTGDIDGESGDSEPDGDDDAAGGAPITLAFAGDVHFEDQLRDALADPATALDPIAPALSDADLTIVNLETAIATGGDPEPKNYTFAAPPAGLDALAAAGVDVVTMANNHGVDFGRSGLDETLRAKRDGPLDIVGIGEHADEAFAPAVHEVRGTSIAVLGATSFPNDPTVENWPAGQDRAGIAVAVDPTHLLAAVRDARERFDVVVVYLHWGVERESCPNPGQSTLADRLVDAGADVIIGSHAHVLQGAGWLSEAADAPFVAYGLGNFVWYRRNSEREATTGVLRLELSPEDPRLVEVADWTPATIHADGVPRPAKGDRAATMIEDFWELRHCARLVAVD